MYMNVTFMYVVSSSSELLGQPGMTSDIVYPI